MRLLLLAVLCGFAASACAQYSADYALFEDASILENIRQRVREGLQKTVDKIKELIEKFKPHLENAKERLADLKQRLRDLATQTGDKLREAIAQIRSKIRQLIRDVVSRDDSAVGYAAYEEVGIFERFGQMIKAGIQKALDSIRDFIATHKDTVTQAVKDKFNELKEKVAELAKEHGSKLLEKALSLRDRVKEILAGLFPSVGYAAEDEEEKSAIEKFAQMIRERVQQGLQRIRDFIAKHKDTVTQAIKDKVEQLRQKIAELAKEHGAKLLEKVLALRERVTDIIKSLFQKESFALYAAEQEEESFFQSLRRRITERLQALVATIKDKLAQVKSDVAEKILPKLEEIRQKLSELTKASGEKLLDLAHNIGTRLQEIFAQLKDQIIGQSRFYQDITEIRTAIKTLRDFFVTDEGIAALKDNAEKASPVTPTGILIKAFILSSSADGLKTLIMELFGGVNLAPISPYQDIRALVKKASDWLQKNIPMVREYAAGIKSSHPVVQRLQGLISGATDDDIRRVLQDIFTLH